MGNETTLQQSAEDKNSANPLLRKAKGYTAVGMVLLGSLNATAYERKEHSMPSFAAPHIRINLSSVTDSTFEKEVLNSKIPVVVEVWASWCAPCDSYSKTLEAASNKYNEMKFLALDYDKNPITVDNYKKYGLGAVPSTMLFNKGKLVAIHTGKMEKKDLEKWINGNISHANKAFS